MKVNIITMIMAKTNCKRKRSRS